MEKYCYSIDVVLSEEEIRQKMDISTFFSSELNIKSSKALDALLKNFNIQLSNLDYSCTDIKVRMDDSKKIIKLPNVSARYYDQNNCLFSNFSIQPRTGTLLSLEGKIFENLNLNDLSKYSEFVEEHHLHDLVYPETKSLIYFKGIEYKKAIKANYEEMCKVINNNGGGNKYTDIMQRAYEKTKATKEMFITKTDKLFSMWYNAPYIYNNINNSSSLSEHEIEKLLELIKRLNTLGGDNVNIDKDYDLLHVDPSAHENEMFFKYVSAYLKQYQALVIGKGLPISKEVVDDNTKNIITNIFSNYDHNQNIYCKITIVSDKELGNLLTTEEKNIQFLKKYSVN